MTRTRCHKKKQSFTTSTQKYSVRVVFARSGVNSITESKMEALMKIKLTLYEPLLAFLLLAMVYSPFAYSNTMTLEKNNEEKVHKLLTGYSKESRFEASGVTTNGHVYYVVFDNLQAIAKFRNDLQVDSFDNRLIGKAVENSGFEGITYDHQTGRFFVVVETVSNKERITSEIVIYDKDVRLIDRKPIDYIFDEKNKGFEGIAHIRKNGEFYLLFLCEGNQCKGGKDGKKRGDGQIQVFHEQNGVWVHVDTIKLPLSVQFKDYSGLDVLDSKIAVTSQEDSRLWIGTLKSSGSTPDDIDFMIEGHGINYQFQEKKKSEYCNVEGVSFVNDNTLVLVSDKKKKKQKARCTAKDQSVHVFSLPY